MTTHIQNLLQRYVVDKSHHAHRSARPDTYALASDFEQRNLPDQLRAAERLRFMLESETPVVLPDERIALMRTVTGIPELFTEREFEAIKQNHAIHEQGKVCNISPAYSMLLSTGTDGQRARLSARPSAADDQHQTEFVQAEMIVLDALDAFADKYRQAALRVGNAAIAGSFERIPRQPPRNLLEALQFLRLIHFALWCSFNYHNTLGRFDQYMYPYYKMDVESGALTPDQALELIEEFFISCNKDSDLYTGMQQGDNGQSMVLGGLNMDGSDSYNELSELCLRASLELRLIDPKINLRVSKSTPLERYRLGSELTRQGLGFPQYENDDVVIPALKRWGYRDEDAYNYVVAACWEFITPGTGMDIPNINGLSFTRAMLQAVRQLPDCASFDELMAKVRAAIFAQADEMIANTRGIYMEPAPLLSLMMQDCVENARDISLGGRYNNYGFHGTGLSTAVDSLYAVKRHVFDERRFTPEKLIGMLDADFENEDEAYALLRHHTPKMGGDDDAVDALAVVLLDWFADALEGKRNDRGGVFRAGTGSAMYYIWHAQNESATPDGRRRGEAVACNYSPSLYARSLGPVSILKSFTKPNLVRVANGGPLTIELHDNMFRNADSVQKVAQYVKSFIDMGGHQMQINAVNRDRLLEAKQHPDQHRNLIVRVWGWSGYFVELDEVYQDHIIERMELSI